MICRGVPDGGLDEVMTRAIMNRDGTPASPDYDTHGTSGDRFSPDGMVYVNA